MAQKKKARKKPQRQPQWKQLLVKQIGRLAHLDQQLDLIKEWQDALGNIMPDEDGDAFDDHVASASELLSAASVVIEAAVDRMSELCEKYKLSAKTDKIWEKEWHSGNKDYPRYTNELIS